MTIDELRAIIRDAMNDSSEITHVSVPEQEEPGEIYVAATTGEDFAITVAFA